MDKILIPKSYLIKKTTGTYACYVIAPPKTSEIFKEYVLKIWIDDAKIKDEYITIYAGNELDRKTNQRVFMFEREVKIPGKKSKRYRFTPDELFTLYSRDKSSNFDERVKEREKLIQSGSGRLLRVKYTDYKERMLKEVEGWVVSPDADKLWVYELEYSPLYNTGKHRSYMVLEEYHIKDISILWDNRRKLDILLYRLDQVRSLDLEGYYESWVPDRYGKHIGAKNLADELTFSAFNRLPKEMRVTKGYKEVEGGEKIRERLLVLAKELEKVINEELESYREVELKKVKDSIKELIGLTIMEK